MGPPDPGRAAPRLVTGAFVEAARGSSTNLHLTASALEYAATGVPIFPCEPDGKAPLTDHGFKDATTNTDRVVRWWRRWPNANIAMPTGAGTFDVLDVDVRPDGDGWTAYNRLRNAGLLRGAVRMVTTPSTGMHLYFPGTGQASGSLKGLFVDLKAEGGYVLLPPSHVRTDDYEGDYELKDERVGGEALDWAACRRLLVPPTPRMAHSSRREEGEIGALAGWLRKQTNGNRNKALYWAARTAVEEGADDLSALVTAALATGLEEREVERTVASARSAT